MNYMNVYCELMKLAQCSPIEMAICHLIDMGKSFSTAAEMVAVTPTTASNIYTKKAEQIKAARLQIEQRRHDASEAIKARTSTADERAEAEQLDKNMRTLRLFTLVDFEHFKAAKSHFPKLTFNQYVLLRVVQYWDQPTRIRLSYLAGLSATLVEGGLKFLVGLGAVLELRDWITPTQGFDGKMGGVKQYLIKVHPFFKNINNREL